MKIKEYRLEQNTEQTLLSAVIGGHELWFSFPPTFCVPRPGDVFVAAAVMPAMLLGEPLEVDPSLPVSRKLLKGLETVQSVFSCWYPMLRKIEIHAQAEEGNPSNGGVGSFFSGGVDSGYTFLKHADEISHLIFVKGIDMQLENESLFRESLEITRKIAEHYRKTLVPVASNVRFFGRSFKPLNWTIYQGAGLASVALALGFRKIYVASTHTYAELFPWGSHPLTDPLWSSEGTEIVHDAADASRGDKLRRIISDEVLFQNLRVCWQDSGYNCGRCEKCLRTMAGLRALGVATPSLPHLGSVGPIKRLRIDGPSELTYCEDELKLARDSGDTPLMRALQRCILRYHTRHWLVDVDKLLFSGRLKRLFGA